MAYDPNSPIGLAARKIGAVLARPDYRDEHERVKAAQEAFAEFGESLLDELENRMAARPTVCPTCQAAAEREAT